MLADKKALKGIKVRRITFNEITRSAVRAAMAAPRDLDQPLIEAYLARRALDYLVGFTLSPVLWRKLPGSRSAGRVQSVALRLICEREAEIEAFRAREYWTVEADFTTPAGAPFTARLTHLDGKKLDQFDLHNEELAPAREATRRGRPVPSSAPSRRSASGGIRMPPFTTSTLQQEASRKLGFGAQQTMRLAQQLYEGVDLDGETAGLITYMRTDGVQIAREAIAAIREHVACQTTATTTCRRRRANTRATIKNAQEAHEAIRPTDVARTPDSVARFLSNDQRRLYELIWKRAVASQMQSAELDQVSVEVTDGHGTTLRATGSIVAFDGFLKLYREDTDDAAEEDEGRMLPPMAERDPLRLGDVTATQHFTQPPPRYSEASLVKKMEELGIGRPSTYASILSVLQDRKYVRLEKRRFIPEDRGRLVTAFLVSFFEHYVDTGFTASMEETARRHRRRECRVAGDAARVLGGVLPRGRSDQGPQDQRRHRGAGSRTWARTSFRRARTAPIRVPARLWQRPARPEARPLRQLHRLLELSDLPVHAAPRDRDRRGPGRDAEGGHARPRRSTPTPARRSPFAAGPTGSTCSRARTAEDKGKKTKAAPDAAAARHGR